MVWRSSNVRSAGMGVGTGRTGGTAMSAFGGEPDDLAGAADLRLLAINGLPTTRLRATPKGNNRPNPAVRVGSLERRLWDR